jgi:uncharacterized protein YndB with AHSA1/START domain
VENLRDGKRADAASLLIRASAATLYRAFLDPGAWVKWLPPEGMTGRVIEFDPREGGSYRMALTLCEKTPSARGKTTDDTDVVQGRFLELVSDSQVVHAVTFASDDPAFAGEMRMTWSLLPVAGGTEVTITCEDVPAGVPQEDHDAGLRSTLGNLARLAEAGTGREGLDPLDRPFGEV